MMRKGFKKGIVAVAMSGGVDSSVAAYLLSQAGYEVIGVTFALWNAKDQFKAHIQSSVYENAEKVAKQLRIPWQLLSMEETFYHDVITYYVKTLESGHTPNPCIICNKHVKWKTMYNFARESGASYLATGHYARVTGNDQFELHRAKDINKDQTYFLSALGQDELAKTIFPLGDYDKREVRSIATEAALPVAATLESQDLCFLGNMDQVEFVHKYAPDIIHPGKIRHIDGRLLGEHPGLVFFTIGQRKGIGIAHSEPLFVIGKDLESNQLIVGEKSYLGENEFSAGQVHWIAGKPPQDEFTADIKIRYRAAELGALIRVLADDRILLSAKGSLRDITPGQAVVMYQGDLCLGMGFIE